MPVNGVLNEDVGHPAYKPDGDLVDELRAVLDKHSSRLAIGNMFGSLLVCLRLVIFAQTNRSRPSASAVHGLVMMAAEYLSKRPTQADDPGLAIRKFDA